MARNISTLIATGVESEVKRGRDSLESVAFEVQRAIGNTLPRVKAQLRAAGKWWSFCSSVVLFTLLLASTLLAVPRFHGNWLVWTLIGQKWFDWFRRGAIKSRINLIDPGQWIIFNFRAEGHLLRKFHLTIPKILNLILKINLVPWNHPESQLPDLIRH